MKRLKAGNIWSGDRNLAVLTNPTCLAKKKGNLVNDYPVVINNVAYPDAERAYQALKTLAIGKVAVMQMVLYQKLRQHPRIAETIKASGGHAFLEKCEHTINGNWWEGKGMKSPFLQCLSGAYEMWLTRK